jgi:hypothetical protein
VSGVSLTARSAAHGGDCRYKGNEDKNGIQQEEVHSDVALATAKPTPVHTVLIGGVEKPREGCNGCQSAA